jgi:hypothetical protein
MPEGTGFIMQAIAAGTVQQLNMQRPQYAFGNFTFVPLGTGTPVTYLTVSEETPFNTGAPSAID